MKIQLSDHFTIRKLLRFVLPSIVMMVFTSIYGVVDGLFVSNFVGKTPFAAINLVMPFLMILGGFGFMIGTGGSALVAKIMGTGDDETANRYFSMLIKLTLVSGLVLSILGVALMEPISRLLGATDAMLADCVRYGRVVLAFNAAFMLQNVFQAFLIAAEKPKLGLYATVAAGVTNMALDALFIAGFGWGVEGAALATGLSQCVGGVFPLIYFARPNTSRLRLVRARIEWRAMGQACFNGASELMSNISGSLVSMLYNFQLLRFAGENGVAAYGVLMYVQFIFIAIYIGYAVGSAPIVSFHFGAENHAELKSMLKKSAALTAAAGAILTVAAYLLAEPLAKVFVGYDAELLALTSRAFRLYALSFLIMGFNVYASSFFTALGDGVTSALISFLRTLAFQVIAILLLPMLLGIDGIWLAVTAAELAALAVSAAMLLTKDKVFHYRKA